MDNPSTLAELAIAAFMMHHSNKMRGALVLLVTLYFVINGMPSGRSFLSADATAERNPTTFITYNPWTEEYSNVTSNYPSIADSPRSSRLFRVIELTSKGALVVRTKAFALNPVDWEMREELFRVPILRWFIPNVIAQDFSGVVLYSSCPDRIKEGDGVYGMNMLGSAAEEIVVGCNQVGKIPSGVSFEKAAGVPTVAVAALAALENGVSERLRENSKVLVIGASGGCGSFFVPFIRSMGIHDVACVSSAKNFAYLTSLGCTATYDYRSPTFDADLLRDMKGKVSLVFDTATSWFEGVDYYARLASVLNEDVPVGYQSANGFVTDILRAVIELPLNRLISRDVHLQRPRFNFPIKLGMFSEDYERINKNLPEMPLETIVFEKSNVTGAMALLKGRHARGKIVVRM